MSTEEIDFKTTSQMVQDRVKFPQMQGVIVSEFPSGKWVNRWNIPSGSVDITWKHKYNHKKQLQGSWIASEKQSQLKK